ncbi:MAG: tRNA dihydrouridine synthase DusB [Syntrophus sp. (in: bacteria)]|nr:tRNA dihydrouridine synthase DusB [Syntrophus sp. (in: bacteria)]
MLTIGNLTLPLPCILAPMAGVSDLPFRTITRAFGAPFAFTEMIDVRALSHRDKRTRHMLSSAPDDRPLGIQLLGNDETHILKTLDVLEEYDFDLLDFNAACPTPKVTRKGKGAALLREPHRIGELLKVMVDHSKVPVTVKIRTGWDLASVNAREVALIAEDAGISGLFIHGRTKQQGYSGIVDYRIIKDVKDALRIPVIASGDNLSVPSITRMFEETGCDGVVIARGALGNPWIFRDIIRFLQDGALCERPDVNERIAVMKDHLNLSIRHYGERRGVSIFHKFFIWYTRELRGAKPFRDRAFHADNGEVIFNIIDELHTLGASGSNPGDYTGGPVKAFPEPDF